MHSLGNKILKYKKGFTLAEVLITLVVIGIISAMTIPALIQSHEKQTVPAYLKKFYSNMNQAIQLADMSSSGEIFEYPLQTRDGQNLMTFYNTYLAPHLADVQRARAESEYIEVALSDGSGFRAYTGGRTDWIHVMYCVKFQYCGREKYDGRNSFLFAIRLDKKALYTHSQESSRTRQQLLDGCKYGNSDNAAVSSRDRRHDCSALIQRDGWQIKDDYPWRQVMLSN